jgi:hypothetical protein
VGDKVLKVEVWDEREQPDQHEAGVPSDGAPAGREPVPARNPVSAVANDWLPRDWQRRFAPYVHVEGITLTSPGDHYLHGLRLATRIRNIGFGAALSLRTYLTHPRLKFDPGLDQLTVMPGQQLAELVLPGVIGVSLGATNEPMPNQIGFRLEYRDMYGRWWRTAVPIGLDLTIMGDGSLS